MSTDGRASFVSFIFNDGEGIKASRTGDLLFFSAGDQDRSYRLSESSELINLRNTLNSFRIDGKHLYDTSKMWLLEMAVASLLLW